MSQLSATEFAIWQGRWIVAHYLIPKYLLIAVSMLLPILAALYFKSIYPLALFGGHFLLLGHLVSYVHSVHKGLMPSQKDRAEIDISDKEIRYSNASNNTKIKFSDIASINRVVDISFEGVKGIEDQTAVIYLHNGKSIRIPGSVGNFKDIISQLCGEFVITELRVNGT